MKRFLCLAAVLLLLLSCALAEEATGRLTDIRVNEFMASNGDTLEDEAGDTPDWIELYNAGENAVNLKGLCISDGKKDLEKFTFPDWVLPAHGYLILFASGEERVTETEIHLPFKLSAAGERVVLSFGGEILDIVSFDAQEKDVSMARYDERTWRFTHTPTPGAENQFDE